MRRIALLTPTFHHFSGIDRVVEGMASRLAANGEIVTVFCLSGSIVVPGVTVVELGMPKSPFWERVYRLLFFFDIVKIVRIVRTLRDVDIVYSHFYPMNILALAAKRFFHRTYWYHNYGIPPGQTFSSLVERVYIAVLRWLTNRTIRSADRIISISRYLADEMRRETGLDSEVEHVTIDSISYRPGLNREKVRREHGIGVSPLVLFVGRVSPHKGIDLLIEAFQQLRHSLPTAHLMIIGKQTFHRYASQLAATAGDNVHFLDFVPDEELMYYYAAADVYATASLWEGYDMPIAEAQACGTAAVAFDIGPHKEIMNDKGILVRPHDTRAFANALREVIDRRKT